MTGLLFHGPEVFDSGWACRIIEAMKTVDAVKCVLAGTMGRTAVIDSGVEGIEFWGKMPGACLSKLASEVGSVVIVNFGKSEQAGLTFGAMVVERAGKDIPVVQIECSGPFFVVWAEGCNPRIIDIFNEIGLPQRPKIKIKPSVWEDHGRVYRRITTADLGDFILVNGIMVGRATGSEVVISCENGHIVEISGAEVKEHGIEKLDRFGGIDLRTVKLGTTSKIRRTKHIPRIRKSNGHGVAFVDHAGMYVYDLIQGVAGVVTVGDDTTAVVGDILYRFQIPVIGIVDGDRDMIHQDVHFTSGSLILTVKEDDRFGLKAYKVVFQNRQKIEESFEEVQRRIMEIVGKDLLARQNL